MDAMSVSVRFALYLDLMLVFGLPLFQLHALRQPERSSPLGRKLVVLTVSATVAGIALSVAGMLLMAQAMTGAADIGSLEQHMVGMMLTDTSFGMTWCLRMGMLLVIVLAAWLSKTRPTIAAALMSAAGGAALATLSWAGHGAMDEGVRGQVHLIANIIHLLAAGGWVGALAAFILMSALRGGDDPADVALLSRTLKSFAVMGTVIVGSLVITGALNYWMIVGATVAGLFSSPYGQLLVAKLGLFMLMLALAAANRYRLGPLLERVHASGEHGQAIAALRKSLFAETCCALLILALVAWFGTLVPMAQ
ncbi:copper homeostasis membrane protein CopD [Herbaspirillum seropedicae]|uniref:copper homeostasis membrane protein CopD n=1 Tax=Herbaspirillum seropedicae TaxID=964 RepID=UPI003F8D299B